MNGYGYDRYDYGGDQYFLGVSAFFIYGYEFQVSIYVGPISKTHFGVQAFYCRYPCVSRVHDDFSVRSLVIIPVR